MSAPQMFWDAILKFIGIKLDLMLDHDIYLFWEKEKEKEKQMVERLSSTSNMQEPITNRSKDIAHPSNYLLYKRKRKP
jgi:hypothetical protein